MFRPALWQTAEAIVDQRCPPRPVQAGAPQAARSPRAAAIGARRHPAVDTPAVRQVTPRSRVPLRRRRCNSIAPRSSLVARRLRQRRAGTGTQAGTGAATFRVARPAMPHRPPLPAGSEPGPSGACSRRSRRPTALRSSSGPRRIRATSNGVSRRRAIQIRHHGWRRSATKRQPPRVTQPPRLPPGQAVRASCGWSCSSQLRRSCCCGWRVAGPVPGLPQACRRVSPAARQRASGSARPSRSIPRHSCSPRASARSSRRRKAA